MSALAIHPAHNSPGKKDVTGAFRPEARKFCALHDGARADFDNRQGDAERFARTMQILSEWRGADLRAVGFFMHGFRSGLQCGANMRNVAALGQAVRATGARIAILYACDAARDLDRDVKDDLEDGPGGAGGFASVLARSGLQVDAHVTTAHTTINPYVRRFLPDDETDHGLWIVEPRGPGWTAWRHRLRKDAAFRLSFPFRSIEEIRSEL